MRTRRLATLALALATAGLVSLTTAAPATAAIPTGRSAGSDRYETSASLVDNYALPLSAPLLIASGANSPMPCPPAPPPPDWEAACC